MSNRKTIEKYYEFANAGKWDAWCDLFTENQEMDEQLAGHISGLTVLRGMMAGMGQAYAVFQNVPTAIIVEGDQGAVVSHISARGEVPRRADRSRRHELLPLREWQDRLHAERTRLEAVCAVHPANLGG